MDAMQQDARYPIGQFSDPRPLSAEARAECIMQIAALPALLRAAAEGLSDEQMSSPYRPEGWSLRQVVHHVADSHLNAYVRLRLALCEDVPTIKPYSEGDWARLPDAQGAPHELSLTLLDSLHARWGLLLAALPPESFARRFNHPEHGERDIDWLTALYAWHGMHHSAQITGHRQRMGW